MVGQTATGDGQNGMADGSDGAGGRTQSPAELPPGLAALGFALAGGLSLVAAAIAFLSEIELARTALQSELKQKP